MSIKLGDVDVAQEIIELHFQLRKTQLLLDELMKKIALASNKGLLGNVHMNVVTPSPIMITQDDVNKAEQDALSYVQTKYPNMGIKKR